MLEHPWLSFPLAHNDFLTQWFLTVVKKESKPSIDAPCGVERLENLRLYQAQMEFALLTHGYSQTWLNNSAMGLEEQLGHAGCSAGCIGLGKAIYATYDHYVWSYNCIYSHIHMNMCESTVNKINKHVSQHVNVPTCINFWRNPVDPCGMPRVPPGTTGRVGVGRQGTKDFWWLKQENRHWQTHCGASSKPGMPLSSTNTIIAPDRFQADSSNLRM